MREALRKKIVDWLDDNYHFGDAVSLLQSDETSFLKGGILDSLGFVKLVLWLEKACKLKIDRKTLSPKNFDSMGKILDYMTSHPDFRGVT